MSSEATEILKFNAEDYQHKNMKIPHLFVSQTRMRRKFPAVGHILKVSCHGPKQRTLTL